MSLAQGNNTPTRPRIEPGSPDPESDALTTRPVPSPLCTKNGSYCENVKKGRKSQGGGCVQRIEVIVKRKKKSVGGGGGGGGGQGRCEPRSEAFVKIQKKNFFLGGGGRSGQGGGQVGGVRVDVNGEVELLWTGGQVGGGEGQGGWEQRIEAFVKIQKKKNLSGWVGREGGGQEGGGSDQGLECGEVRGSKVWVSRCWVWGM